jgi:hypothetical protein
MMHVVSNPANFTTKHVRKKHRNSIKQALVAAINLTGSCCKNDDGECVCCKDVTELTRSRTVYHTENQQKLPIVMDSGASVSVTPNVTDFVGAINSYAVTGSKGLNSEANMVGEGTVEWMIQDVLGSI